MGLDDGQVDRVWEEKGVFSSISIVECRDVTLVLYDPSSLRDPSSLER
jgi:hypothetical protein